MSLVAGGSFQNPTDANFGSLVGTRWDLSDGREVIFVSCGATAIGTSGVLCQDAAIQANHQGIAVNGYTTYSANGNVPASVSVNLGATAVVPNQYQGGFVVVDSGTGLGQTLRIQSHPAAVSSGTLAITLEDPASTALATASTVCLIPPHGANVVIYPTTVTGAAVGVTLYTMAAGQAAGSTAGTPSYGFLVSKGLTSMLSDALIAAAGQPIGASITIAGSSTLATGSVAVLGYANQTGVSNKGRSVFVNL